MIWQVLSWFGLIAAIAIVIAGLIGLYSYLRYKNESGE